MKLSCDECTLTTLALVQCSGHWFSQCHYFKFRQPNDWKKAFLWTSTSIRWHCCRIHISFSRSNKSCPPPEVETINCYITTDLAIFNFAGSFHDPWDDSPLSILNLFDTESKRNCLVRVTREICILDRFLSSRIIIKSSRWQKSHSYWPNTLICGKPLIIWAIHWEKRALDPKKHKPTYFIDNNKSFT